MFERVDQVRGAEERGEHLPVVRLEFVVEISGVDLRRAKCGHRSSHLHEDQHACVCVKILFDSERRAHRLKKGPLSAGHWFVREQIVDEERAHSVALFRASFTKNQRRNVRSSRF